MYTNPNLRSALDTTTGTFVVDPTTPPNTGIVPPAPAAQPLLVIGAVLLGLLLLR